MAPKRGPSVFPIHLQTILGDALRLSPGAVGSPDWSQESWELITGWQKGGFPKGWFWWMFPRHGKPERGYIRMFPGTKTGTRAFACSPGTRPGTFGKTTLLRNRPVVSRRIEAPSIFQIALQTALGDALIMNSPQSNCGLYRLCYLWYIAKPITCFGPPKLRKLAEMKFWDFSQKTWNPAGQAEGVKPAPSQKVKKESPGGGESWRCPQLLKSQKRISWRLLFDLLTRGRFWLLCLTSRIATQDVERWIRSFRRSFGGSFLHSTWSMNSPRNISPIFRVLPNVFAPLKEIHRRNFALGNVRRNSYVFQVSQGIALHPPPPPNPPYSIVILFPATAYPRDSSTPTTDLSPCESISSHFSVVFESVFVATRKRLKIDSKTIRNRLEIDSLGGGSVVVGDESRG